MPPKKQSSQQQLDEQAAASALASPGASGKKGWDAVAHEDLLLAYLVEFKPNKASIEVLTAKMKDFGYGFSYDAVNQHLHKLRKNGFHRHTGPLLEQSHGEKTPGALAGAPAASPAVPAAWGLRKRLFPKARALLGRGAGKGAGKDADKGAGKSAEKGPGKDVNKGPAIADRDDHEADPAKETVMSAAELTPAAPSARARARARRARVRLRDANTIVPKTEPDNEADFGSILGLPAIVKNNGDEEEAGETDRPLKRVKREVEY